MGSIRKEVREKYLNYYSDEEKLLKPFLAGFHVTYAARFKDANTELSIFFLNPENHIKEGFCLNNEILLAYAPYDRMEPRTMQALEKCLSTFPAKGRVDRMTVFLISDNLKIFDWLNSYISENQESRIIVAFTSDELKAYMGDSCFVRNILYVEFYGRDLFNYTGSNYLQIILMQ